MAALHFEALNDADSPLVPFFPSCGGTDEADPIPGLQKFLNNPPASFAENLKTRDRRTYVASRSVLWMSPAMLFFQRGRQLPYYVVEVNSGAGLNLASDHVMTQKGFDSGLVAARIGLEPQPLDLNDIAHRRWLTAGIWPDNVAAIAKMDEAIDVVEKRSREEATFIQLAPCPTAQAPGFIAKNIPADDPDVGLLVFNMGVTVRMSDAEYAAFASGMAQTLKPWGERAVWIEVENVRGETYSTTFQLRVHRLIDGHPRTLVMVSFELEPPKHIVSDAAPGFLDARKKG